MKTQVKNTSQNEPQLTEPPISPPKPPLIEIMKDTPVTSLVNIVGLAYHNDNGAYVSPSSYNYIGEFCIGPCMIDCGCSFLLLKISSADDLEHLFQLFPSPKWQFRIGCGWGTAGTFPTLIIKSNAPTSKGMPVTLSQDVLGGKVIGMSQAYRFHLCGEDIRNILEDKSKVARFDKQSLQIMETNKDSPVRRLGASLIGSKILKQSMSIVAENIIFFIEPEGNENVNLFRVMEDGKRVYQKLHPAVETQQIYLDLDILRDYQDNIIEDEDLFGFDF